MAERDDLKARIAQLITRLADGGEDSVARDALLTEVGAYQARHVAPYGRLLRGKAKADWLPALPTDVFRHVRVASHEASEDVKLFRTSGTTQGLRGQHPVRDLTLYDTAAEAAARHALFPDHDRMRLLILAPTAAALPDSSLSYMLSRFLEWFGAEGSMHLFESGELQAERLREALTEACEAGEPVALLGTSFAFVFAEEALGDATFALPEGSRVMQTGGFKGRTREYTPEEMDGFIITRYGVPLTHITSEYGMTELCSQMYGAGLRRALRGETPLSEPRALWVPGWVRATPVDPATLQPVPEGEVGILRIDDLANLDSVSAIQTADFARRGAEGIVLLGRDPNAVPRGCSLSMEEALAGGGGGRL